MSVSSVVHGARADGDGGPGSDRPRRWRRPRLLGVALVAALLLSLHDSALAAAATLYVDEPGDFIITNDQGAAGLDAGDTVTFSPSGGTQVPQAGLTFGVNAFGTIQSALAAAGTNDTINVAEGTFSDAVFITKTVTLRGNQAGIDARTRTSGTETILNNSTDGVVIAEPGVVVDGFTFQGLNTTGGLAEAALYIPITGDNFQVRNNIFRDSITGLAVSSNSTVGSLVEHNLFRDNAAAGTTVGQTGLLLLATIANVTNLTVNENRFMGDHPVAAIQAVGSPAAITDVAITGNQIEDGRQIRLANLDSSSLTGNTFSGALSTPVSTGPALLLRGGNDNLLISGNTFTSTHLTPLPRTMLSITDDLTGFGSNTNVAFTGNTVTLNAPALPSPGFSPMLFIGSLGGTSTVSGNTVTISRPASGALSTVAGMQVESSVTGTLSITDNILHGGSAAPVADIDFSPGIALQLATPVTVNLTIANNTLDRWVHGVYGAAGSNPNPGAGLEIRGNEISASVKDGISVISGSGAWLRENRIVGSGDLGIDLSEDGVTPNDTGDDDSGPNERQNYPVLATAATKGGQTLVTGTLNSVASTTFHVELFASEACNASGFGEGQVVLGGFDVTTNGSGNATFSQILPTAVANGSVVTATATRNATRDTSEFSACRTVQPVGVTVSPTSGLTTSEAGGVAAFAVVLTSVPAAIFTINLSSSNPGEATVSPTTLTFTPANALVPQIVTVTGVDDPTPDGTVAYGIVTAAATSADPFYNGLDPADVSLAMWTTTWPPCRPHHP